LFNQLAILVHDQYIT